jgi:hypothetical protein
MRATTDLWGQNFYVYNFETRLEHFWDRRVTGAADLFPSLLEKKLAGSSEISTNGLLSKRKIMNNLYSDCT